MAGHTEERFGTRAQVSPGLAGTTAGAESLLGGQGALLAFLKGIFAKAQQQQKNAQTQLLTQQTFSNIENQARQRLFQEAQQRFDTPIPIQAPRGAVLGRKTPSGVQRLETTPRGIAFQEGVLPPQKQLQAGRAQTGEQRAQQEEFRKQTKFTQEQQKGLAVSQNATRDLVTLVSAFQDLGLFKGPELGRVRGATAFVTGGRIGGRGLERLRTIAKPLVFSLIQFTTGQTNRSLSDADREFVQESFRFDENMSVAKFKGRMQGAVDVLNNRIKSQAVAGGQLLPDVDKIFDLVSKGIDPLSGAPIRKSGAKSGAKSGGVDVGGGFTLRRKK